MKGAVVINWSGETLKATVAQLINIVRVIWVFVAKDEAFHQAIWKRIKSNENVER